MRSLLDQVSANAIDEYVELEEALMAKQVVDPKTVLTLLDSSTKGSPNDKLRLFAIYLMSTSNTAESAAMERALETAGCDMNIVKHLKGIRSFQEGITATVSSAPKTQARSVLVFFGLVCNFPGWFQGPGQ